MGFLDKYFFCTGKGNYLFNIYQINIKDSHASILSFDVINIHISSNYKHKHARPN